MRFGCYYKLKEVFAGWRISYNEMHECTLVLQHCCRCQIAVNNNVGTERPPRFSLTHQLEAQTGLNAWLLSLLSLSVYLSLSPSVSAWPLLRVCHWVRLELSLLL